MQAHQTCPMSAMQVEHQETKKYECRKLIKLSESLLTQSMSISESQPAKPQQQHEGMSRESHNIFFKTFS